MKRFLRPLLWTLVSALVLIGLTAGLVALMEQKSSERPAVALQTLSGETVTLDQLSQGKPMVVNLWATWCPPCIREMPVLAEAQQANQDITFVFVNQGEHTETAAAFLDDSELNLTNVVLDSQGKIAQITASMALPTTLFYNARGEQVDLHRGELHRDQLNQFLSRLR